MASLCRSVAISAVRSAATKSRTAIPKTPLLSSSSRRAVPLISRSVYAALGTAGTMMPLHSTVASARLNSFLCSESLYWSLLSQGHVLPS